MDKRAWPKADKGGTGVVRFGGRRDKGTPTTVLIQLLEGEKKGGRKKTRIGTRRGCHTVSKQSSIGASTARLASYLLTDIYN